MKCDFILIQNNIFINIIILDLIKIEFIAYEKIHTKTNLIHKKSYQKTYFFWSLFQFIVDSI